MASKLASFMSGAQLVIYIGGVKAAFAQGISFQESMDNVPVGGIGSFSYHAIEPLRYSASGSITITRWSKKLADSIKASAAKDTPTPQPGVPRPIQNAGALDNRDGNSLLDGVAFNPVKLLASSTFDIHVYSKLPDATGSTEQFSQMDPVYTLKDCRMSGYSFGFNPASLLQEGVTFICTSVSDEQAQKTPSVNVTTAV